MIPHSWAHRVFSPAPRGEQVSPDPINWGLGALCPENNQVYKDPGPPGLPNEHSSSLAPRASSPSPWKPISLVPPRKEGLLRGHLLSSCQFSFVELRPHSGPSWGLDSCRSHVSGPGPWAANPTCLGSQLHSRSLYIQAARGHHSASVTRTSCRVFFLLTGVLKLK